MTRQRFIQNRRAAAQRMQKRNASLMKGGRS